MLAKPMYRVTVRTFGAVMKTHAYAVEIDATDAAWFEAQAFAERDTCYVHATFGGYDIIGASGTVITTVRITQEVA